MSRSLDPLMPPPNPTPVALITGASSGIGREVALQLAVRHCTLALVARGGERLEAVGDACSALGSGDVLLRSTDMAVPEDVLAMVDAALDAFGRIDILINNAGLAEVQPLGQVELEHLEAVFAINAIGPALAINCVWPGMVKQGGGRIVNVSSIAARDPFPGLFAYAAAKSALSSMTRSIAGEGRAAHIKAFTVAPGAVETPMLRSLFDETMIGADQTLPPADVAQTIVECAMGERDELNGEVIWLSRVE